MWTDRSPELIRAIKDMHVPHGKATPSRHQNNAYCERTVRKIVHMRFLTTLGSQAAFGVLR